MQGKQAIIDKIINDARILADSIRKEAEEKRDKTLNDAMTLAGEYKARKMEQIDAEEKAIISRKKSAAEIEVKKMLLQKKQDIIAELFDTVITKIKEEKEKYKKFLVGLIEKYGENNDTVIISVQDKDILSKKDVNNIAASRAISLNYDVTDKISGGVILKSAYYDKNFSLSALLKHIKEQDISDVSDILFGREL